MSDAVSERIVIAAPPEAVWDVIADFPAYPEWGSDIREVEVLERDADGWGTRVRMVVDAKVVVADFVLAYTYRDDDMRWEMESGQGLKRNDGSYTVVDRGDGTTELVYELTVEPAVKVPGFIRRKAAQRIVDGALRGVKRQAERS